MRRPASTRPRLEVHLAEEDLRRTLEADVRRGLCAQPKVLPPKYFYDARGSELFERITRLPEYYPTRTERAILTDRAVEIARVTGADTLLELGSGSSEKTRLLLDGLAAAGTLRRYIPVDVSPSALTLAMDTLSADYPDIELHGVVADFESHLELLPPGGRRLVAFLGGTIGNLDTTERSSFLASLRAELKEGDWLLLGTDLVKDPGRLVPAYDDAAGVTAAFNRNVLRVLNGCLGADFDPDDFDHVAVWDPEQEWVEMRLRARRRLEATVSDLGLRVSFEEGEEMRTEISAKFRRERVEAELGRAGLAVASWWTDPAGDYALSLSTPASDPG